MRFADTRRPAPSLVRCHICHDRPRFVREAVRHPPIPSDELFPTGPRGSPGPCACPRHHRRPRRKARNQGSCFPVGWSRERRPWRPRDTRRGTPCTTSSGKQVLADCITTGFSALGDWLRCAVWARSATMHFGQEDTDNIAQPNSPAQGQFTTDTHRSVAIMGHYVPSMRSVARRLVGAEAQQSASSQR